MDHLCLRDEDLAGAADLPDDSPARRQWMACARCRARVAAFAEFLQPSTFGSGPEWDEADARLAAALENEIHDRPVGERVPTGQRSAPFEGGRTPEPRRPVRGNGGSSPGSTDGPGQRLFRWLLSPSLRPVGALAVLVVALVTIQGIRLLDRPKGDAIVLRDGATPPAVALEPREVERRPDGALSFSWNPVEGADRYEVVFYGDDLAEKMRFDAAAAVSYSVPAQAATALTGAPPAGSTGESAPLFWRVIAYRGGDVAAQSRIRPLRTQVR